MSVTLQTGENRIDFWADGERFTSYRYGGSVSGFSALNAAGGRPVTQQQEEAGVSVWLEHRNVNGFTFGLEPLPGTTQEHERGRIVTAEITARRGSQSVGFQHICLWLAPDRTCLLTETRTVRVALGPGEGRILDISVQFLAPDLAAVRLEPTPRSFLFLRPSVSLWPSGGGQLRNSQDDYGVVALDGHSAEWCACVGVVESDTVGFVVLDHPANVSHPPLWGAQEDGLLSVSPLRTHPLEIPPGREVTFQYRILVHRGYVASGWATARLAEFIRPSRTF